MIDDKGGARVFQDVADALHWPVPAFRLFVDGDVKRHRGEREAHRHEIRRAARIGGREMADATGLDKAALSLAKHALILRQRRRLAYGFAGTLRCCPRV